MHSYNREKDADRFLESRLVFINPLFHLKSRRLIAR